MKFWPEARTEASGFALSSGTLGALRRLFVTADVPLAGNQTWNSAEGNRLAEADSAQRNLIGTCTCRGATIIGIDVGTRAANGGHVTTFGVPLPNGATLGLAAMLLLLLLHRPAQQPMPQPVAA